MRFMDWIQDVSSSDLRGCFSKDVARQKGGSRKTRIGKCVNKTLHDVRTDHVRAVTSDAPTRQIKTVGCFGLARHTACANIIAKGRRIADRRAGIATYEIGRAHV